MNIKIGILVLLLFNFLKVNSQAVPNKAENIDYIVTFGKSASGTWGDDDHSQVFFFAIPESFTAPFYIRVFDPDCGGMHDQINNKFNTQTTYTLYGGDGAYKNKAAINVNPEGDYKSGVELASQTFGLDENLDNKWYSFGPFNPSEGEYNGNLKARIFKFIAEGVTGDDGNMYRYFLSNSSRDNIAILGANAFTYEYTFRLKDKAGSQAYFYPFVDKNTVKIVQHNFDFDNDGSIKVYSATKNGHYSNFSNGGNWSQGIHTVDKEEQ